MHSQGSLNPIDAAESLKGIPQTHFIGKKDTVIPRFIAQSFISRLEDSGNARIIEVDGCTHAEGWIERWPALLAPDL